MGNNLYNGSLCPQALEAAGQCSRNLLSVRQSGTVIMSNTAGQRLTLTVDNGGAAMDTVVAVLPPIETAADGVFTLLVADVFNNLPPAGATVSVSLTGCELLSASSVVVPNTSATGPFVMSVTIAEDPLNPIDLTGVLSISLSNPAGGSPQAIEFGCTDTAL